MSQEVWRSVPAMVAGWRRFLAVLAMAFPLAGQAAPADPPDFSRRAWSTAEGLPDTRVHCVAVTPEGHVWAGTRRGLARFDGRSFFVFHPGNTPELGSGVIRHLATDAAGRVWVLDDSGTVVRFDGPVIRRLPPPAGLEVWQPVRLHREHPDGVLVQFGRRLYAWDETTDAFVEQVVLPADWNLAWRSSTEELWVVPSENRLVHSNRLSRVRTDHGLPPRDLHRVMFFCVPLAGGGIRFAYGDSVTERNLVLVDCRNGRLETVREQIPCNGGRPCGLLVDVWGMTWLSAGPEGIWRLGDDGDAVYPIAPDGGGDFPLGLAADPWGRIWVGTEKSGLVCLVPRWVRSLTREGGLPHDNVRMVSPAGEGRLLAGTDKGLAVLHVPADGPLLVESIVQEGYSVRSTAGGSGAPRWLGTSRGLFRWDSGGLRLEQVPRLEGRFDEEKLGSQKFPQVAWDGDRLWALSAHLFWCWERGAGRPRILAVDAGIPLTCFHRDSRGNLWVGSQGGVTVVPAAEVPGLLAQDRVPVSANLIVRDNGPMGVAVDANRVWRLTVTNGLPNHHVWYITETRDQAVWLCTEGGVVRVAPGSVPGVPAGGRSPISGLFAFTGAHGLPDPQVNSILEDDAGWLWFGTDTGIFAVPAAELQAVAEGRQARVQPLLFGVSDGLPDRETSGRLSHPGACRLDDGRLCFATSRGVAVFDPVRLRAGLRPPVAHITEIRADGELAHADTASAVRARSEGLGSDSQRAVWIPGAGWETRLEPGRGRALEIHFDSPGAPAPELARFRYRLEGFEGGWNEAGPRRVAHYHNLPPGRYRFAVRARDAHGLESAEAAMHALVLAPQVWQTAWFRSGVALAAVGLGVGWVRWRGHRQERLAREEERARLARSFHDHLGAGLASMQVLIRLARQATDPANPAREHLDRLACAAQQCGASLRQAIATLGSGPATLTALCSEIAQSAADLLEPAGIRCRFDWPPSMPDAPVHGEAAREVVLAVREAMANALRHAGATQCQVALVLDNGRLQISITDNGRGFDPATVVRGNGLDNFQRHAEVLGGHCRLESNPGRGTRVEIDFPQTALSSRR